MSRKYAGINEYRFRNTSTNTPYVYSDTKEKEQLKCFVGSAIMLCWVNVMVGIVAYLPFGMLFDLNDFQFYCLITAGYFILPIHFVKQAGEDWDKHHNKTSTDISQIEDNQSVDIPEVVGLIAGTIIGLIVFFGYPAWVILNTFCFCRWIYMSKPVLTGLWMFSTKKRIDFCTTCGSTLLDYSGYPKAICRPNSCLFNIVLPVPLNRTCHAQLGGGSIAQVIHNLRSRYGTDISESSLRIACFN